VSFSVEGNQNESKITSSDPATSSKIISLDSLTLNESKIPKTFYLVVKEEADSGKVTGERIA
jgi:hypothetical protein